MRATILILAVLAIGYSITRPVVDDLTTDKRIVNEVKAQFGTPDERAQARLAATQNRYGWALGGIGVALFAVWLVWPHAKAAGAKIAKLDDEPPAPAGVGSGGRPDNWHPRQRGASMGLLLALLLTTSGCWRPFEPNDLKTIQPNEEGFLIPLKDAEEQEATHSEEMLRKNLVNTKQVRLPQQWVQTGFEWLGFPNGEWRPGGILITVDRSPVTREWTADTASGTSNKNEAIWVMTSDQVEFSTGWTCTARIATRDDAVKFLYNYRNESIKEVMDREVRAFVQTAFGAEVTDEPMSKLRNEATPHIQQVIDKTTKFFGERGLTITNLGISGGFVYKDSKIQEKLVELFNAETAQQIATAEAATLQKTAQGKADAAKLQAEGEAEAIKVRADAKAYEIEKTKENLETFLDLRRLELAKDQLEKWDGRFPTYYIGTQHPNTLLTLPGVPTTPAKTTQAP